MKVGVTFFVRKDKSSIWNNGAAQNCIFLYQLLERCSCVEKVYLINGGDGDAPDPAMMIADLAPQLQRFEEVRDEIDILIEAGAQIEREHEEYVHARGGKVIAYRFGNAYVIDTERVIHDQPAGSIINGTRFDEIWTNPQHLYTCESYWETLYRCPVRCVPHIWSPLFVEKARSEMDSDIDFRYRPGKMPKDIVILEPNINIVKTCQIPMLICEELYRRRPELIGDIYVTNAFKLKSHLTFRRFCNSLDIVKNGRCSFEYRYNTPFFVSKFADVVVSHQWENALNYLYYEVLEAGYPLIHSSTLLYDAGYYYPSFDIKAGAVALELAILSHDDEPGIELSSFVVENASIDNPINISSYSAALTDLISGRKAA